MDCGYDLINETNWPLGQANKNLKDLFVRITEGIRSTGVNILYTLKEIFRSRSSMG